MKNCLMCKEPFTGKREDSKFCSNSCKAKHWELKKNDDNGDSKGFGVTPENSKSESKPLKIKIESQPLEPFLNLVGDIKNSTSDENNKVQQTENTQEKQIFLPVQYINKTVQEHNFNYVICNKNLILCRKDISNVETEIKRLTNLIELEKKRDGSGIYVAGAGSGALIAYNMKPTPKSQSPDNSFLITLVGGLLGLGLGKIIDEATTEGREKSKRANIQKYEKQKADYQNGLQNLRVREKQIIIELNKYPPFELKEIKSLNPAYTSALKQIEEQKIKVKNSLMQLNGISTDQIQQKSIKKVEEFESNKITSMQNIAEMKFKLLNFQGKWKDFFGLPQTNFFCVVHGMSGEGKSHFSMQFAKYLAENFGKVLFVSGEEGFAPTFQQKIKLLGADIPNLYAGDIRTGNELLKEVPNNKFHFIVVDSLNNMGIDPEIMRKIRNKFKDSAIIAICQNTKEGKVRGSYEIMHDSDMIVKVADGMAVTIKNRFKEKNMQFDVFEVLRKKESRIIPINRKKENEDTGMDSDLRNTI